VLGSFFCKRLDPGKACRKLFATHFVHAEKMAAPKLQIAPVGMSLVRTSSWAAV
jgi:hypothetical protein